MNIYIKAMEIGFNNPKGIRYRDLKNDIEKFQGFDFSKDQEFAFVRWVLGNFTTSGHYTTHFEKTLDIFHNVFMRRSKPELEIEYTALLGSKFFIKGETVKQYLDYVELKESRDQSRKAFIFSMGSILLAVLSIILTWFLSKNEAKPPYDVRIIDDQVKLTQLENEIDSLKNELGRAAMIIDIYESNQ